MRKILLLLLLAPLLSHAVLGQQKQAEARGAELVQAQLADEQLRLVHSQPYYAAGERLWFKAFINKRHTSPLSKVLHVALLDAKGNELIKQQLVVENGTVHGDMLLPKELLTGYYTLMATTNWMKNFSKAQQYREQLLVVNAGEVKALHNKASVETARQLQVQFLPESGSLLAGVTTRVAVVVTNAAGAGVAATGTVVNEAGERITTFESDKTGIAILLVKLNLQEKYTAQVQAGGYTVQQVTLPEARQSGMALAVKEQNNESITVAVSNTTAWPYTLLAVSGGKVYFSHSAAGGGAVTLPGPANSDNPVRLFLLNPGGLVEAEQQVARQQEEATLRITTDQKQYGTRQQVSVTVQATDKQGAPVAVTAAAAVAGLQLYPVMPLSLGYTAKISASNNKLLEYTPDKELWAVIQRGESKPTFKRELFVNPFAPGSATAPASSKTFIKYTIDTAFVQSLPESIASYALQHYTLAHLNDIYGLTEPHAVTPLPKLPTDKVFKPDDYVAFSSMEETIKEITTNIKLSKHKGKYKVRLLYVRDSVKKLLKEEPLYLVDGVVVKDAAEILALKPEDVASIEVAWTEEKLYAGNLGQMADNGIFAVYTKSGEARERLKEKGYTALYDQYSRPNSFVAAPHAGTASATAGNIPDFRQMIFWEPQLQLDQAGKATFSFYTSDATGNFTIKVQGQTSEGVPVSGEAVINVSAVN